MRALLLDVTRCAGCGACLAACAEEHGLPQACGEGPAKGKFTVLRKVVGRRGEVYYRRLCMHCLDPACVSVCPVGALKKTPEGPVAYDPSICMGCRYCLQACPYDAPRWEWNSPAPRLSKCSFCAERIRSGGLPACAEVCPTGATTCGEREALLALGRARLEAAPGSYVPRIYGEREAGGTSVLYLSPVPFRLLGLPENLPEEPLPRLTQRALGQVPPLSGGAALAMAGLWWLTNRRREVQRAERGDPARRGGVR